MEIRGDQISAWKILKEESPSTSKQNPNQRDSYELGLSVKSTLNSIPKGLTYTEGGGCCSNGGGSVHCVTQCCK